MSQPNIFSPLEMGAEARSNTFDRNLADTLMRLANRNEPWLHESIVQSSAAVQQGHSCVPLQILHDNLITRFGSAAPSSMTKLHEALCNNAIAAEPGAETPLISDGRRLYLRRYYEYERQIALNLARRTSDLPMPFDASILSNQLDALFPPRDNETTDWQRVAATIALRQRFTLICGGPGSGKTWTVLRLLALLVQQSRDPLRIALAAATGKAARRVSESLQRDIDLLPLDDAIRASLPREASTLHRLLGLRPHSIKARHDAENPLPLDVLVLDEASMIDLPNMARLLEALPAQARLILLGDPDQLASVEAGSVLSELRALNPNNRCSANTAIDVATGTDSKMGIASDATKSFSDKVVTLTRSHRFAAAGAIAQLIEAVRVGDADAACDILRSGQSVVLHEAARDEIVPLTLRIATQGYAQLHAAGSPQSALAALAHFRILAALREGPGGTRALNSAIARSQLNLSVWQNVPTHFNNAPILIGENDYALGLYNGDTGVLLQDEGGNSRAYFADAKSGPWKLASAQLPKFELSYAITVHKAQGSEYDSVLVMLPPDPHVLLTREWLYTALSRAREKLAIVGTQNVLRAAIANPAQRWSGLAAQIAQANTPLVRPTRFTHNLQEFTWE